MTGQYVVFESVGKAVLKDFEIPDLNADEVLLESDYSVISAGTELANLMSLPNTVVAENGFPFLPGYSAAGRVIATGNDVSNLSIGDRVVIPWGGHRSHVIKHMNSVVKIEDNSIDSLDASFAHIVSFSLLGVRKLHVELGEAVMIAGMGILGAFAAQIASLSGAVPVIVADLSPERRKLALELGADYAFSPEDKDFINKIKEVTGGKGPEAVVEVSGSAKALQQALEYIAWEGRISLLGCTRVSDVPIDFYKYVHRRGISLIGAHTFTRAKFESAPGRWTEQDDYKTFLKLLSAGRIQTRSIISEIISPEKAGDVFAQLAQKQDSPLGIVFDWGKIR